MNLYQIDEFGRAIINSDGLFELWFQGQHEDELVILPSHEIEEFNRECASHAKIEHVISGAEQPPVPHSERIERWLIPHEFKTIDVESYCLALCAGENERERVMQEMVLFRDRNLEPLLQTLIYMVSVFRKNKIVWGLGRGSSVASFVLFLIGVHKINPLTYELDIKDFLR